MKIGHSSQSKIYTKILLKVAFFLASTHYFWHQISPWSWIIGKTIKISDFINKSRSICLLLTEIWYWLIKPIEKGKHTSKRVMLQIFYLLKFFGWTHHICAVIENFFLFDKFFTFTIEWFPAIRYNAKQTQLHWGVLQKRCS